MKAKGIETKPYPTNWYDIRAIRNQPEETDADISKKEFDMSIAVNKKPYFMRYVYSDVMRDYNEYYNNSNNSSLRRYLAEIPELLELYHHGDTSDEQNEFIDKYLKYLPVSDGDCVVNRICHRIENEFGREYHRNKPFDHKLLMSGVETDKNICKMLAKLFKEYSYDNDQLMRDCNKNNLDGVAINIYRGVFTAYYREKCERICSNDEQLCDSLVQMCYTSNKSKQFVWDMCGDQLIRNLLRNTGGKYHIPVRAKNGQIEFRGEHFDVIEVDA